ncbi:MAG: hypothetical protein JKY65_34010 [Planctomycetes bacterium]|nr:hypothetical protein [Planctomycetota bacterium]
MKQLACGHLKMRVDTYTDDYRWVVRCEECGSNESWTQREWRTALLVDESSEGPPLRISSESPESARLVCR